MSVDVKELERRLECATSRETWPGVYFTTTSDEIKELLAAVRERDDLRKKLEKVESFREQQRHKLRRSRDLVSELEAHVIYLREKLNAAQQAIAAKDEALRAARHAMEWYEWHKCSDHDCMEYKAKLAVEAALHPDCGKDFARRMQVAEEALEKLSRLGNEPMLGNSIGNRIAQDALQTLRGAK